jgi:hypothetical protein
LSALAKLLQVAQTGQPLESFYDKKQSHQLHEFVYQFRERPRTFSARMDSEGGASRPLIDC